MNCPSCKAENDDLNAICSGCGFVFEETDNLDSLGTQFEDPASESMSEFKTTAGITDLKNVLSPGTLFAKRYEILDKGMFGGMGAVYKVMDKELHEVVALKLILPAYVNNKSAVERFKQEVKIARNLVHPNLVRVYDLGESDDIKYFTMEYIEGNSLRDLLDIRKKNDKPFNLKEASDIISQLCDALHYAHEFTVHRDIKPENILMPRDDKEKYRVKVTDFGLAKMITPSLLSMTTHRMGTPYYMSPEQLSDSSNVDKRADIYSLGVILYELLTLSLPIGRYESLSSKRPELPPAIDAVVDRALETQPEKRFSDAIEMSTALQTVMVSSKNEPVIDESAKKPLPEEKVQREAHGKSSKKIPVIAAVLIAFAVAGYFVMNSISKTPPSPSPSTAQTPLLPQIPEAKTEQNITTTKAPKSENVIENLDKAVEADKKVASYITSAKHYLDQKKYDSALEQIAKVLQIDSGNAEAYQLRSDIETQKKINEFEMQKARAEKERQKKEIAQYLNEGKDYYNKGKYQLSIEKMKEVIYRDSNNYTANKYVKMANQKLEEIKRQFENPVVGRSR